MSETVCAVVVTYNRKELLLECLEALRKQTRPVQGIYLIDNASTDGAPKLLLEKGYIKELPSENLTKPWEKEFEIKNLTDGEIIKLHYVRMHENTGSSGGFYEGVKRAYEKGYDWLWLMDDDAEPKEDALEKLVVYFNKESISALACNVILPSGEICFNHRGYIDLGKIYPLIQKPLEKGKYKKLVEEIDMASFVGILVNKKAIEKIGYPKKEFFIHHDDVEYCIRLRKVGQILLVPDSVIIHKEAAKMGFPKIFFGRKSLRIPYNKFWLTYYGRRNLVWLGKKYSTNKLNFYFGMLKTLIRSVTGVILFDDNKLKRIKLIVSAYIDGLKGDFDNEKPKRILYENSK